MSPRGIPRHSAYGYHGRLGVWLIAFNFERFRVPLGLVIFFAEYLPMGCNTTYNVSWVLRTIWIAPECHQTTHLCNYGVITDCPRNSRKRCSYVRSKSCNSVIYHSMSLRGIPWHSMHGSRGRLKTWFIAFNFDRFRAPLVPIIFYAENLPMGVAWLIMHFGFFAPYELSKNATKWPIYYFVVQPWNDPERVVKVVLIPVQSNASSKYTIQCPIEASHDIWCTNPDDV